MGLRRRLTICQKVPSAPSLTPFLRFCFRLQRQQQPHKRCKGTRRPRRRRALFVSVEGFPIFLPPADKINQTFHSRGHRSEHMVLPDVRTGVWIHCDWFGLVRSWKQRPGLRFTCFQRLLPSFKTITGRFPPSLLSFLDCSLKSFVFPHHHHPQAFFVFSSDCDTRHESFS